MGVLNVRNVMSKLIGSAGGVDISVFMIRTQDLFRKEYKIVRTGCPRCVHIVLLKGRDKD